MRIMRGAAAWIAVAAILFSQLATAAFACPGEDVRASQAMSSMGDCERSGGAPPPLCLHHCSDAPQSLDRPATPSTPAATGIGFIAWPAFHPVPPSAAPSRVAARANPPPEPPPHLRTCVLRI